MRDVIRNIFFEDEITYRTYNGKDKVFRQTLSNSDLDLGPGSEVEIDLDKQVITKVYKAVNSTWCYCNHCGKRFRAFSRCINHSRLCEEKGYLRHPEGEDLDGVYRRRKRINSNNG